MGCYTSELINWCPALLFEISLPSIIGTPRHGTCSIIESLVLVHPNLSRSAGIPTQTWIAYVKNFHWKIPIVNEILLVNTIANVKRKVWRIWILILGGKGLKIPFGLHRNFQDRNFKRQECDVSCHHNLLHVSVGISIRKWIGMSFSKHVTNSWTRNDFHASSTLPCPEGDFCQKRKKKNYLIIAITDLKDSKADGQEDTFTFIFPTFPLLFKIHLHF